MNLRIIRSDGSHGIRVVFNISDEELRVWNVKRRHDMFAAMTHIHRLESPDATISDKLFAYSEMAKAIENAPGTESENDNSDKPRTES